MFNKQPMTQCESKRIFHFIAYLLAAIRLGCVTIMLHALRFSLASSRIICGIWKQRKRESCKIWQIFLIDLLQLWQTFGEIYCQKINWVNVAEHFGLASLLSDGECFIWCANVIWNTYDFDACNKTHTCVLFPHPVNPSMTTDGYYEKRRSTWTTRTCTFTLKIVEHLCINLPGEFCSLFYPLNRKLVIAWHFVICDQICIFCIRQCHRRVRPAHSNHNHFQFSLMFW